MIRVGLDRWTTARIRRRTLPPWKPETITVRSVDGIPYLLHAGTVGTRSPVRQVLRQAT